MSSSASPQFPSSCSSSPSSSAAPPPPPPPHPLAAYGWDDGWHAAFAPHAAQGLLPGRVVRVDRGRCHVVTPDGTVRADTEFVTPRDPLRVVCTGDWAAVDPPAGRRFVRTLLPRRTAFVRSTSSKRSEGQVLAANVDHAVLCVSLAAEFDLGRLERFLALAWGSGARPLVVLTKADLVPDPRHLLADAVDTAPGVDVALASAATGEGVDDVAALLTGGTAVLLGQSGAGKSTLANALLGERRMEVQEVRDRDGKGRHTTTTRELALLPAGGVLIDTPGLRGVGLWDAGPGLEQAFAEVEELAARCRFPDCRHEVEPGCAVLAALADGSLAHRRLDSYRKLQRENLRLAARTDARLRAEQRKVFKQRQALGRHMMERKRGRR
ncbi:ribosome small subunit-dependent GTPase A [Streptomyces sp. 549]|uniref:ribosome small subunit-dependent GTPase A n=1 Tax=Streptomyces sp. 549 TaxID=3049076 RepID=UPI0024C3430B|nr:ribosome small subunit-dependent GTPase A [Streptomyces sp. 549]MDK1475244.1 ribosome small subunit-dependent GTPase A [Streptomyces sp. 549]